MKLRYIPNHKYIDLNLKTIFIRLYFHSHSGYPVFRVGKLQWEEWQEDKIDSFKTIP